MSSAGGLDFGDVDALTFDCYGTLIDWERGILAAIEALLGGDASPTDSDALLEEFARYESEAEGGDFRGYRDVLRAVAGAFGAARDREVHEEAADQFAGSVPAWPPFADTVSALRALAGRYRLAIVSNVDDDLFAGTAAGLGVDFETVVTAQQVRSYKPAPTHFHEALARLGLPKERVVHVAQSLHHDIGPAKELGFACVWVNRRGGREGGGATPRSHAVPDLEVPDLATLARVAGAARAT